ncbi:MAG: NfeD family protein [Balneola sp.]|jgi:membrane protein implicated in regulation of membrane protease activity|nr:NfeD family protein [Balneola sp.]
MDSELLTWIFLIGGVILMLLEFVIPSGMALILGSSGLLIALARFLGFLDDPITATMAWIFTSAGISILAMPFIRKYLKGETSYKFADEDYEAMDQIVEVVEPLNEHNDEGRIRFQGISWQARTLEGEVPAGTKVKIKYRDNTTWIVEPVDQIQEPTSEKLKHKN